MVIMSGGVREGHCSSLLSFSTCYTLLLMLESVLVTQLCLTLMTPWAVAHQAPLSMEFSRQESLSGLPFPSPADPPDPLIEPRSLTLQADS